ncbi:hypothetical protein DQ04_00481050 [Trypanosoma grayi]|uniref:hypothetical protein n=1 Tax=Trypanosoma grayi TaxID=71804 RepID=UPI0004F49D6D|nr:hypothetical protein DQ04_00481050 [Trypanosoma grayi]KEG14410.1 hypothetical protein DQ04_00481050 [Trypanosoma grayi]
MAFPVYIAKCRQCGNTRQTYNDPRLRRSVIECKAACYESHYEWDFVEECKEEDDVVGKEEKLRATTSSLAPAPTPIPVQAAEAEANVAALAFSENATKRNRGKQPKRCIVT